MKIHKSVHRVSLIDRARYGLGWCVKNSAGFAERRFALFSVLFLIAHGLLLGVAWKHLAASTATRGSIYQPLK